MVVAHAERIAPRILTADEAARPCGAIIGGKAEGLVKLGAAGANVPPWFVVPAEWMTQIVARANVDRGRCDATALVSAQLPRGLVIQLGNALAQLGPGPYAVRSSMAGEDSEAFSYAGQLETFLHQHTEEDVQDSLRKCWASAFADRVTAYRARAGESADPMVAVVIQRMLAPRVSGVAFTAHPTTGRRDHLLISAAWGLGEGVVSGECNTDDIVWARTEGLVDYRVGNKDRRIAHDPTGAGTRSFSVTSALRRAHCLSKSQVKTLARELIRVADALGAPQDIEWSFEGDELYLLQSRPITALPVPTNHDGPQVVFDNSNIQESYCGVTTPLTFSFAVAAYASVYEQTFRVLGLPESELERYRPVFKNLLGLIRGRVYYNINNWYRGLSVLPSFGRNKEDMERMMGVTEPVDFVEDEVLSLGEKLRRLPRMLLTLGKLLRGFRRLSSDVPTFLKRFENCYAAAGRDEFEDFTFSELIEVRDWMDAEILGAWHVPIVNDFFVMMAMGKLRRIVESSGLGDVDELISSLLAGEPGIESTEPTRALMRIAAKAREHEADFDVEAIDVYVERYGDRVIGELKLETITLREDRTFVYDVLDSYRGRPDLDADSIVAKEQRMRRDAETTVETALSARAGRSFRKALAEARASVKNRENMRLARTRAFGLYREVYLAIGARLTDVGKLDCARDVFYLTVEEITAYHGGTAICTNLAGLVAVRKAEYETYGDEELPHRFVTQGPVYHGNRFEDPNATPVDPSATDLVGIGCYPGTVEAEARVIMKPDEARGLDGQILVTVRTDPGWAPLFPTCSGILVERGSALSHSAVVARELGIPAVVGVPNLTKIVQDGERLRLDGGAGVVVRLD